jgi:hypothetical protein
VGWVPWVLQVTELTRLSLEGTMLFADGALGLVLLGVWIYCFIDVLLTPPEECRNIPKLAWVFVVLLLSDLGSIAWLVAGKNWGRFANAAPRSRSTRASSQFSSFDRPARHIPTNPDDDEEFLAGLRRRAEEQRRRAKEQGDKDGGISGGS